VAIAADPKILAVESLLKLPLQFLFSAAIFGEMATERESRNFSPAL